MINEKTNFILDFVIVAGWMGRGVGMVGIVGVNRGGGCDRGGGDGGGLKLKTRLCVLPKLVWVFLRDSVIGCGSL